ncbi:MAG: type II toxin-antitoxin system PemK/MazF family toxin [Planctomycetes bacterium]|nr:type II toxin-antitoxin system PemK/MazF family toxin [Planctomycetota bacterium]
MRPGELYWADLDAGRRPLLVVSREELNRGNYVVAVLLTTANLSFDQVYLTVFLSMPGTSGCLNNAWRNAKR